MTGLDIEPAIHSLYEHGNGAKFSVNLADTLSLSSEQAVPAAGDAGLPAEQRTADSAILSARPTGSHQWPSFVASWWQAITDMGIQVVDYALSEWNQRMNAIL